MDTRKAVVLIQQHHRLSILITATVYGVTAR